MQAMSYIETINCKKYSVVSVKLNLAMNYDNSNNDVDNIVYS